jgi:phosphoesterase RecJ-like protein
MNYQESIHILEEIEKAENILINCHRGPDPDSIGSALAIYRVLKNMGKKAEIICSSRELYESINYLTDYKNIQKNVDFSTFDFSKFDLFITLDSSSWDMVSGYKKSQIPKIKIINIDHHLTSTRYGYINLIDENVTSTGELLYRVIKDLEIEIDPIVANCLMTAIVGDTGAFGFPNSTSETFLAAADLIKLGADKDKIIQHLYRNEPFNMIKFYGEVLMNLKIDLEGKFVWAALPYEIFKKFGKPNTGRESAASLFTQVVEGTDFGFLAVEQEEKVLSISFRSRTGFDTSKIAFELGGGGHIYASGARITGLPFAKAVEKLLETVKKFVN